MLCAGGKLGPHLRGCPWGGTGTKRGPKKPAQFTCLVQPVDLWPAYDNKAGCGSKAWAAAQHTIVGNRKANNFGCHNSTHGHALKVE